MRFYLNCSTVAECSIEGRKTLFRKKCKNGDLGNSVEIDSSWRSNIIDERVKLPTISSVAYSYVGVGHIIRKNIHFTSRLFGEKCQTINWQNIAKRVQFPFFSEKNGWFYLKKKRSLQSLWLRIGCDFSFRLDTFSVFHLSLDIIVLK